MTPATPNQGTQEWKVLRALLDADGAWVNKQHFVRALFLTQSGRAIWNLENKYGWSIEHSDFTDEHGFKSYRIVDEPRTEVLFARNTEDIWA